MMSYVPAYITNAAFEGHMAITESLRASLGREPSRSETAQAMAEAYGDMLALLAGSGAQAHQINAINRIAQRAYNSMLSTIMASDCGGSA